MIVYNLLFEEPWGRRRLFVWESLLHHCSTSFFQFVANGSVQPLLIAAGGGGSSDKISSATTTDKHNARGLVNPWAPMETLLRLVSKSDVDAGEWKTECAFKDNKIDSTSDSWEIVSCSIGTLLFVQSNLS